MKIEIIYREFSYFDRIQYLNRLQYENLNKQLIHGI